MSEYRSFDRPLIYSADGGETWIHERPGRHLPGSNRWLREFKAPMLRIFCTTYGRRRLFGIVHALGGVPHLKLATLLPPSGDSAALNSWPLSGAWGEAHAGTCPCGHIHTLDVSRIRERVEAGERTCDVRDVSSLAK